VATITSRQLRTDLADTLNRVAYAGERVIIERHGKPVAAIVSVEDLASIEAREDAEDIADHIAAMAEAREKGTVPFRDLVAGLAG
jgi:prevent-host-death family protein